MTHTVYKAIAQVMRDISHSGIAKDQRNSQQGYQFRGIDSVYNALSPILAEHGLCMLPRIISRQCEERQTGAGKPLFYVTVEAEYDLVAAEDGSVHTIRSFGEAMDSADKATNKAMSAAYKYAAMQAFCIPTEGDNDADASTPDVVARQVARCNAQQLSTLVEQMLVLGRDQDSMLHWLRGKGIEIRALSDLPADKYEWLHTQLERWISAMPAKEAA